MHTNLCCHVPACLAQEAFLRSRLGAARQPGDDRPHERGNGARRRPAGQRRAAVPDAAAAGFAPAPLRHDGGAAMPSARDSGSSDRTAAEQGRRGSDADSVLGNAVQHDLDAFSAVSLPPLPLPAPDHERMATEPHQIASPMAGASTVDTHTHSRAPPVHNQQKRTWPRGGSVADPLLPRNQCSIRSGL